MNFKKSLHNYQCSCCSRYKGQGESEAITLAIDLKAGRILLDERDGRKIAKSLGLKVTGVLGILLRANQEGELSSLSGAIDALIETAGFRISPELLAKILAEE